MNPFLASIVGRGAALYRTLHLLYGRFFGELLYIVPFALAECRGLSSRWMILEC